MAYSVLNLKSDLTGMLHGTTLNQVTNLDGCINRAASQILEDFDPQETKRITPFANPIFSQVYDYACPADLKGNRVIDIRPQVNRQPGELLGQQYNRDFDLGKAGAYDQAFTISFNNFIKTIRVAAAPQLQSGITLNDADSITSNGTWTVGGNASNLSVDNVNFAAGVGCLKFDLATTGVDPSVGYLEVTMPTGIDLTTHLNQATEFLYSYLPTATGFDSIELWWGTDNANYYKRTATLGFGSVALQNGWNLMNYDWLGCTVVGAPTITNIKYLRVVWNYDGSAQTGVRLDNIVSRLGSIMDIEYYSKYLFRDATTGAFQETVTDDSNLINLDTEAKNILLFKTALYVGQQVKGKNILIYDAAFLENEYKKSLDRYKAMYKSEVTKPQSQYYTLPDASYSKFLGRTRHAR